MPDIYVSEGLFNELGRLKVRYGSLKLSEEEYAEIEKKLSGYVLRIDYTNTRSYDNSDDDRVEDSYSSSDSYVFRSINFKEDSKSLLMLDGEIKGVVYVVDNKDYYPFLFDGSYKSTVTLGYSASHSSQYTYINKVSLVKKGTKGVSKEEREAKFKQSGMFPSL